MATESNLKSAVLELRNVFAQHLPADDVPDVLRKAVEKALAEVLGDAPKRRGRPAKGAAATPAPAPTNGRNYHRSPAVRRKQAKKMRAYWAARRAAEGAKKAPKKKRGRPAKEKATPVATETPSGAT